jgi:hypothetical protein
MTFMAGLLKGAQIEDVYVDSEVTYLMLTNGTQVTVHGLVMVQPGAPKPQAVIESIGPASARRGTTRRFCTSGQRAPRQA